MKTHLFTIVFTFLFLISGEKAIAQSIDLEKTYEITKKSKKGTLANVEFDEASGNYTLYYITKSTEKMAKIEIYVFDKDFNFISQTDEEMEFEKVKTKYNWFNFKSSEYTVTGLFVEPNLTGTLVMKKKEITYSYDWLFLGYHKKVKILEKLKPKTEDGSKFQYISHFEDEANGHAYVLAGEKEKISKNMDPNRMFTKYHLLKFNLELDILADLPITFEHSQNQVIAQALPVLNDDPDNPGMGDMVFVFAPMKSAMKGMTEDSNKGNFTYVRVNQDMKLVDRVSFDSPSPGWKIDEIIYDAETESVYAYGPSAEGKDAYWAQAYIAKKYKAVQLLKIADHKLEYITSTNLEKFELALKTPPSQKKSPAYEGKKFQIASYTKTSGNDFLVLGQNYTVKDNVGKQFTDVLGFHFNNKGELKAQYGVDTYETNDIAKGNGAPQSLIEGASGKNLYWVLNEIDGFAPSGRLLTYARIAKIDLSSAEGGISDFITLGGVDKKISYFLDQKFPYLQTSKGNTIVFFGADKKGKNIWFCRVKID